MTLSPARWAAVVVNYEAGSDLVDCVITGKNAPACTPEFGFLTTVACTNASDAAESGVKHVFKPEDFVA